MLIENKVRNRKKHRPLCNIFLQQKGEESNSISISRGLEFARKELFGKLKDYSGDGMFAYFFDKSNEPQAEFYELMDLWEVIKEYIPLLKEQDRKRYSNLFELIYEMDGHHYCLQYWKLREKMGGLFEERLAALCRSIEKICNSKQINILDQNMNLKYKISLEHFAGYINDFNYMHIKQCLAETMIDGGIATVVAGSDGLTPKRLHGFELANNDWRPYPTAKLEEFREFLLRPDVEVMGRSGLRGEVF